MIAIPKLAAGQRATPEQKAALAARFESARNHESFTRAEVASIIGRSYNEVCSLASAFGYKGEKIQSHHNGRRITKSAVLEYLKLK